MHYSISVLATLYGFWLLLSGYYTAFLLAAGLGSALAVVWFARRMGLVDAEGHPVHLGLRVPAYWAWLLGEMVKSAWHVTCIVLHPRLPVSPALARFKPAQRTDLGLVIHANSITLTPGTLTVEARPDCFVVHALTEEGCKDLAGGEMDRRVAALEGPP